MFLWGQVRNAVTRRHTAIDSLGGGGKRERERETERERELPPCLLLLCRLLQLPIEALFPVLFLRAKSRMLSRAVTPR
jgi:hypothetical protein